LAALVLAPLASRRFGVTLVSGVLEAERQAELEPADWRPRRPLLAASAAERRRTGSRGAFRRFGPSLNSTPSRTRVSIGPRHGAWRRPAAAPACEGRQGGAREDDPFWTLLLSRRSRPRADPLLGRTGRQGVLLSKTEGLLAGLFFNFSATVLGVAIAALLGLAVAGACSAASPSRSSA
jgi:hypothetical protein